MGIWFRLLSGHFNADCVVVGGLSWRSGRLGEGGNPPRAKWGGFLAIGFV